MSVSHPSRSSHSYDAIVIGAGPSGLAAAIRLAMFGKKVCLLEKHGKAGGLNSYYRRGHRHFDSGLHALTNFSPKGNYSSPLGQILKQLRLPYDALGLSEQKKGRIIFPQVALGFTNDIEVLKSDVADKFPHQREAFDRLLKNLWTYHRAGQSRAFVSTQQVLSSIITDSLLRDMLAFPVFAYGSAWEGDMDYALFSILFRSIYLEGLARPQGGIRPLLQMLLDKFEQIGGERRFRTPVAKIQLCKDKDEEEGGRRRLGGVVLKDGTFLSCRSLYSSAGLPETLSLVDGGGREETLPPQGNISVVQTTLAMKERPGDFGLDDTMIFYNGPPHLAHQRPEGLIDSDRAVICLFNNFHRDDFTEGRLCLNNLANYQAWHSLYHNHRSEYKREKERVAQNALETLKRVAPAFCPTVEFTDVFTPTTIERYTGHFGGTLYGGPVKRRDGKTSIEGLFICGNDQGFVGLTGAMLSGITMANRYDGGGVYEI